MKTRKRGAETGGFTLIELLLAITILALIVSSVTAGLRLASTTIGRGEEVVRDAARLRAAIGIIERSIRSADPLFVHSDDRYALFFVGEDKRLLFLSAQPVAAFGSRGSQLVSFHEITGPGGGLAVSTASPFRTESWEGTEEPRILIPGAEELTFSYSAGPDEYGRWDWSSFWDPEEEKGLPSAVRVEFTIPAGEASMKTAFVVPVMTADGVGM